MKGKVKYLHYSYCSKTEAPGITHHSRHAAPAESASLEELTRKRQALDQQIARASKQSKN
jgi:hypothetical protein